MTVFLCILTMLVLTHAPSVKGSSTAGVLGAYALWIVLILGLATLAVWTWSRP